jgi:hypothetical protein
VISGSTTPHKPVSLTKDDDIEGAVGACVTVVRVVVVVVAAEVEAVGSGSQKMTGKSNRGRSM